jgi:short-subunit dehydrogenase
MAGRTIIITGSSRGLGRSLAIVFAKNEYNIILHGRDENALIQVKEEVLRNGVDCDTVRGDITSEETIERLFEIAEKRNLDGLINNAGIYVNKPFHDTAPEKFRQVIEVNLLAPIILTKKIYPIFQRKKSGLIININSMAGKYGSEGESAYCASKHGLRGFTRSIQFEANRDHVRVFEVYLGTMNTGMVEGRRDPEKCIQTAEAAEFIYGMIQEYPSMKIDEVDLSRRRY